jgi:hypothetical protein
MRCCWVYIFWSQVYTNRLDLPSLTDYGWKISDNKLKFVWDTDANFQTGADGELVQQSLCL